MLYPQGNFYPQGSSYPQFGAGYGAGYTPFAQSPYGSGFPPQIPGFAQGLTHSPPWQQSAVLQQAIQQHLAQQQATQHPGTQIPMGLGGVTGLTNGAVGQPLGTWPQQGTQQPHHHLLQQLAQLQYVLAQQLAQLAAQHAMQGAGSPYAGQFIPGQAGAGFVPGVAIPGIGSYVPGSAMH